MVCLSPLIGFSSDGMRGVILAIVRYGAMLPASRWANDEALLNMESFLLDKCSPRIAILRAPCLLWQLAAACAQLVPIDELAGLLARHDEAAPIDRMSEGPCCSVSSRACDGAPSPCVSAAGYQRSEPLLAQYRQSVVDLYYDRWGSISISAAD